MRCRRLYPFSVPTRRLGAALTAGLLAGWLAFVAVPTAAAQEGEGGDVQGGRAAGAMDRLYQQWGQMGELKLLTEMAVPVGEAAEKALASPAGRAAGALAFQQQIGAIFGDMPKVNNELRYEVTPEGGITAALGNYGRIEWPVKDPVTGEVAGRIDIGARNMLFQTTTVDGKPAMEIYAEGDVQFVADTPTLQARFACDRITFLYPTFQGLASKVRMRSVLAGNTLPERHFLDTSPGESGRPREGLNTWADNEDDGMLREGFAIADEVRIIGPNHAELINAVVTGDGFAQPHWGIHMPAALYRANEKIEAYNPTVRVGKVPVLWLPYVLRDLKYEWPWVRVTAGRSGRWGWYQRTAMAFKLPQNENRGFNFKEWMYETDTFSDRGWGLGAGIKYKPSREESWGSLSIYNIHENWISGKDDRHRGNRNNQFNFYKDIPRDPNDPWHPNLYEGDNRLIAQWEHYQRFNDRWDLRAEARYYRDADVGMEYDRDNYLGLKDPTASFSLRRRDELWQAEIVAQKRINNWLTQNEYLPELRASAPEIHLLGPLYFDQDLRVGVVNRRYGKDAKRWEPQFDGGYINTNPYTRDPFADPSFYLRNGEGDYGYFFRALGESRLSAPLKFGFATLTPWVGARYGYYGDTYGKPYIDHTVPPGGNPYAATNGGAEADAIGMTGATLSTRLYNTFGKNNDWRLMLEPEVAFAVTTDTRVDPVERYPLDSYDDYGKEARLRYGMHGKLQRRDESGQVRDVLDAGVHINHYPRSGDQLARFFNREFSELDVDAVWRPTKRLTFWGSALYDTEYSRFNRVLGGVDWRYSDRFRVYAAHARYAGRPEDPDPYETRIDETTFAIRSMLWNLHSRYSGEFAITYNWGDDSADTRHGIAEYRIAIYRNLWDNFELGLNYTVNYRRRDSDNKIDRGYYVTLSPMGFMGYKRPPVDASTSASAQIALSRYADQPDPRSYAGNRPGVVVGGPGAAGDMAVPLGAESPDWLDANDPRFQEGFGGYAVPLAAPLYN